MVVFLIIVMQMEFHLVYNKL
ncbi:UNVERIFIED_CONTAM: hypothetical protein GTU68_041969 [Idotea baltica]|nr:hypothetical protein [Idotea baltica]